MKKQLLKFFIFNLFVAFLGTALTIQAQTRPYRVSDNQVQTTLTSIEAKTDIFRRELDRALNNTRQINSDRKDEIMRYVTEFENSTDSLKERFEDRRSVTNDVTDVLTRAASIDQFIKNNRLNVRARTYWNNVAADLDRLQGFYRLSGNWRTTIVANTGQMPYRVSDNEVQLLLSNIETDTDLYRRSLDRALNRTRNNTINKDQVLDYVTEFENATDQLKERFENKRSVSNDVQEVLTRAAAIDGFMRDNRLNQATERNWTSLKTKLDTLSNYYNVAWNWTNPIGNPGNNTGGTYNVSEQTVRMTIANIEARTNIYKRQLTTSLNTGVLNNTRSQADVIGYVSEFERATNSLKQNFNARRSTSDDVQEVLNRAYYIDGFMRDYRFQQTTEREWRLIRTDLEKLSGYYSINFDFDNRQPTNTYDANLTGTYRLNLNQSDNVASVVANSTRYYPANQRERISRNLENRLKSPDMLAIEKRDNQVTIASSNSPQISFEADGVARTESMPNGRSVKITAISTYDGVSLSYEGDRINDFYVNFVPVNNNQLKVIRRVYLENKNETITVASVYDKVNQTAQWSTVNNGNTSDNSSLEDFIVPNNTPLTATLNTPISTEASQNGDRFTLTVISPSQYDGATIEGRVASAERSGRVSGRANLSLEFDTIRLRNGSTYRFAGIVDKVRMPNGDEIAVNNEGTVRDGSQTTKTVTRAGIGAAIGAIIGAIAGGGQGAAIGAAVGAGAGAGTVVLQGRDDINLQQGTEFTLTATAPNSTANYR